MTRALIKPNRQGADVPPLGTGRYDLEVMNQAGAASGSFSVHKILPQSRVGRANFSRRDLSVAAPVGAKGKPCPGDRGQLAVDFCFAEEHLDCCQSKLTDISEQLSRYNFADELITKVTAWNLYEPKITAAGNLQCSC